MKKPRTYSDYYRAYIRALRHNRLALAARLHSLAHDAARDHSMQRAYDCWIDAAVG